VAVLHLLLALVLIVGLRLREAPPDLAKTVQITLQTPQIQPPPSPPMPRLDLPQQVEAAAPVIAIAPPPPITSVPQGAMTVTTSAGSGSGGNSSGGQGTRVASVAPPAPVVTDPNCETVDAYVTRVRSAINRFFDYPERARVERIQGEVMMHFLSDPGGKITGSAVSTSTVERIYRGREENGRYHDLIVAFARANADSWSWQARVQSDTGADVVLGKGTVRAGADDVLRSPDRADGMMLLDIPDAVPAQVARVSIRFGSATDLFLLETSVQRTLRRAQPLPPIPACLKLTALNAMMPFRFHQERRR
jgi:outer membrane biosynthesis protein TonB